MYVDYPGLGHNIAGYFNLLYLSRNDWYSDINAVDWSENTTEWNYIQGSYAVIKSHKRLYGFMAIKSHKTKAIKSHKFSGFLFHTNKIL